MIVYSPGISGSETTAGTVSSPSVYPSYNFTQSSSFGEGNVNSGSDQNEFYTGYSDQYNGSGETPAETQISGSFWSNSLGPNYTETSEFNTSADSSWEDSGGNGSGGSYSDWGYCWSTDSGSYTISDIKGTLTESGSDNPSGTCTGAYSSEFDGYWTTWDNWFGDAWGNFDGWIWGAYSWYGIDGLPETSGCVDGLLASAIGRTSSALFTGDIYGYGLGPYYGPAGGLILNQASTGFSFVVGGYSTFYDPYDPSAWWGSFSTHPTSFGYRRFVDGATSSGGGGGTFNAIGSNSTSSTDSTSTGSTSTTTSPTSGSTTTTSTLSNILFIDGAPSSATTASSSATPGSSNVASSSTLGSGGAKSATSSTLYGGTGSSDHNPSNVLTPGMVGAPNSAFARIANDSNAMGSDPAVNATSNNKTQPDGGWEWPWWEGTKAFISGGASSLYNSGKALVTGRAGMALGDRAVDMVENRNGELFTGTAGEWGQFSQGIGGDMTGINPATEAISGYDLGTQSELDDWERAQRGASAVAAMSGMAAGGAKLNAIRLARQSARAAGTAGSAGSAASAGLADTAGSAGTAGSAASADVAEAVASEATNAGSGAGVGTQAAQETGVASGAADASNGGAGAGAAKQAAQEAGVASGAADASNGGARAAEQAAQEATVEAGVEASGAAGKTVVAPNTGPGKFDTGPYNQMKGQVPGLDAHHVGQQAAMKRLVPGYDPATAPTILVPKVGHTIKGPNGIVSRSADGLNTARDVIARDINELRRVYPDIPNSKLQELIQTNKNLYGLGKTP